MADPGLHKEGGDIIVVTKVSTLFIILTKTGYLRSFMLRRLSTFFSKIS